MAQRNYECMFVLNSGKYASDPAGAENVLMQLFARLEAEVVAKNPWQDGKLAYPIDGHRKGLHYLVYFRMDGSQVTEMSRLCKLNDLVLRHMVIEHSEKLFDILTHVHGGDGAEETPAEGETSAAGETTAESKGETSAGETSAESKDETEAKSTEQKSTEQETAVAGS